MGYAGSPSTYMGFHKWVADALQPLNDFVRQVVVCRWERGIPKWHR